MCHFLTFQPTGVTGDPLFTVPIPGAEELLCYEIHGEAGYVFNLVSDKCLSVSAAYEPMETLQDINIIKSVGVKAVDTSGICHSIEVNMTFGSDRFIALVDNVQVVESIMLNRITVQRLSDYIRITVPDCEFQDTMMWVMYQEISGQRMLQFIIDGGSTLAPTSHGLLGELE